MPRVLPLHQQRDPDFGPYFRHINRSLADDTMSPAHAMYFLALGFGVVEFSAPRALTDVEMELTLIRFAAWERRTSRPASDACGERTN